MSRIAAVVAFALACLSQPLALDACSVSCEAARAARAPAVAAPCHHTTSCATQISQPTSPGSTAVDYSLASPIAPTILARPVETLSVFLPSHAVLVPISPPISTQLRM